MVSDLQWRVIPGFSAYAVSEFGDVKRVLPGTAKPVGYRLKPQEDDGYLFVSIVSDAGDRLRLAVHILVALAFIGRKPSPRHEVAHDDGIRQHNHFSNLRWDTRKGNHADLKAHGTSVVGERNGNAKLSDLQIADIRSRLKPRPGRKRLQRGMVSALAKEFGVCTMTITSIVLERRRTSPTPPRKVAS